MWGAVLVETWAWLARGLDSCPLLFLLLFLLQAS
jgi:hypothetical protein